MNAQQKAEALQEANEEAWLAAERFAPADDVLARRGCRHRAIPLWPPHHHPGWHSHEDAFHRHVYQFILDDETARVLGRGLRLPEPPALPVRRTSQATLNRLRRVGLLPTPSPP